MIRRKSTSPDPELAARMAQLDSLGERMRAANTLCRTASARAADLEDRGRRLALALGQNAPLITVTKERQAPWPPAVQTSPRTRRSTPVSATTTQMSLPST